MQIPSDSGYITKDFTQSTCAMETGRHNMTNKDTTLHNNLAKFVLDLQSDVTLEDLLDNSDSSKTTLQPTTQQHKYQTMELNDEHREALKQLYDEIKYHQGGLINTHNQPTKRRSAEDNMGYEMNKALRNSESSLLQDADGIDENWLMNLASQMGLDKKIDLPELITPLW